MSYSFEDLSVGLSETYSKTVSKEDVHTFAAVTGDNNPVHLDEEYAANTSFGEPIAHGMLTAGFISAAIGTKLPGPGCIYLEQTLKFRSPVLIGKEVQTTVTVKEINERRRRVVLETVCHCDSKKVVTGEATIMLP
ncbi:MaoC family dehydratase [Marinomonas mediterranea]|jgi:Acyl dehydratase|uniref:MaoC domain protein dehydratase n=1 Tax=Marinomonas mediterranea (strain ATCC 700492 / JCM 21426 / NBRC 103028 / MMB-1) TaxID=717774 RepID=F2K3A8_MARM1|nr:MaoC family dehydratase [Marinomonas mediterranea]ADZ91250.1 MaoC domain protein dehydratase [Marinomonas mediterranea MMB-1]WCN09223.1 acyl dehydratase [Marinomonas mediterranea]WCN13305.1 acyl dehydratase [Marinomonas mediterranea]WCN17373.1 acyl dehydratase [Marinomonas mediterranea MMB-1]